MAGNNTVFFQVTVKIRETLIVSWWNSGQGTHEEGRAVQGRGLAASLLKVWSDLGRWVWPEE